MERSGMTWNAMLRRLFSNFDHSKPNNKWPGLWVAQA
jgi:hypothetical protein